MTTSIRQTDTNSYTAPNLSSFIDSYNKSKPLFESKDFIYSTIKNIELYQGDALRVLDYLISLGVKFNAIITDPPFGTTACKWDTVIPFTRHLMVQKSSKSKDLVPIYKDEYILRELKNGRDYQEICEYFDNNSKEGMWCKLNKLIYPNGVIILFGSEPFSSALRMSNIENYKYDWVYQKTTPTGHLNAYKQPLRVVENVMVFYKNQPTYNPQKTKGHIRKVSSAVSRGKSIKRAKSHDKVYNNEILEKIPDYSSTERYPINIKFQDFETDYHDTIEWIEMNYPAVFDELCNSSVQIFSTDKQKNTLHPTQKPIELMKYLINSYTNKGDSILDFTCGSGSTLVASDELDRKAVGIDNGFCDKDKIINGIHLKGMPWTEITKLRIEKRI